MSGRKSKVGGSFTAPTVTTKLLEAARPPASVTTKVSVLVPDWFVAGRMEASTVPLTFANCTFADGIMVGLEDRAEQFKLAAAVSRSFTAKANVNKPSSFID